MPIHNCEWCKKQYMSKFNICRGPNVFSGNLCFSCLEDGVIDPENPHYDDNIDTILKDRRRDRAINVTRVNKQVAHNSFRERQQTRSHRTRSHLVNDCYNCNFEGIDYYGNPCFDCKGTGYTVRLPDLSHDQTAVPCLVCEGWGYYNNGYACQKCRGKGYRIVR